MFKQYLKEEYPFAVNFFESALKHSESKLFHSFILSGSNPCAQYDIALETARYLNCEDKEHFESCECRNCRWTKENRHPAVITVSPIDYLEGHKDGEAKSVISVDQIRHLRKALSLTSPYHRIIIFTGAQENTSEVPITFAPPPLSGNDEKRSWLPSGLSQKIFKDSPSNAVLKSIEEPNDRVTFFFLSANKEDLLPTIISRSQCINVVSNKIQTLNTDLIADAAKKLPPKNASEAMVLAQEFINLSKNHSTEHLLDMLSEYFKVMLEQNVQSRENSFKIIGIIEKIQKAKLQTMSYVSPQNVVETLFLSMLKK